LPTCQVILKNKIKGVGLKNFLFQNQRSLLAIRFHFPQMIADLGEFVSNMGIGLGTG
jgi:hypothetical protein